MDLELQRCSIQGIPYTLPLLKALDSAHTRNPIHIFVLFFFFCFSCSLLLSYLSDKPVPITLHQANILTVDRLTCGSDWSHDNTITKTIICIQSDALMPGTFVCSDDDSVPIVDKLGLTLYGVSAYGVNGCTATPLPNVGSSVSNSEAKAGI